jgi:hypothetical protein
MFDVQYSEKIVLGNIEAGLKHKRPVFLLGAIDRPKTTDIGT